MTINGFQKTTLLDYPGKVACTVFTGGCNLRCPFCHNAGLVLCSESEAVDEEVFFSFLKKRKGILDGVVITGGEPLLHPELFDFLHKIRDLGFLIKLDTNGTKPDMLRRIVEEGLADRIAMDIKNSPEVYFAAVGINDFCISDVEASKNFLMSCGIKYEFRTTVVKGIHTKESLVGAAKWINGAEEYYLQQFKDSGNLIKAEGLGTFSAEEISEFAEEIKPYVKKVKIRGI